MKRWIALGIVLLILIGGGCLLALLEIENLVQQHSGKRYTRAVTLTE